MRNQVVYNRTYEKGYFEENGIFPFCVKLKGRIYTRFIHCLFNEEKMTSMTNFTTLILKGMILMNWFF